jgi:CRP/FNR family transcriptional regulator, cyclic AMP receptor protein
MMAHSSSPASAPDVRALLVSLEDGVTRASYAPNEAVFTQGEAADAVFYIESGEIQISAVSERGKEGAIDLFTANEFFGEDCLAGQPVRMASAIARTEAVVTRIPKQTMIRALQEEAAFAAVFIASMQSHYEQIEADLLDQLFKSSD